MKPMLSTLVVSVEKLYARSGLDRWLATPSSKSMGILSKVGPSALMTA
jgi:hypothetical protein